jgi:hypothetical protein
MASLKDQHAIAARCRRIGWRVEDAPADKGTDWIYRITRPNGRTVPIHRTPSTTNWVAATLRRLNGRDKLFDQAEEAWKEKDERQRKQKLAAAKTAGDKKLADVARRAQQHTAALTRAAGPHAVVVEFDPAWLLTPHELPEYRQGILTPELAGKLLSTIDRSQENRHQRNYRQQREKFFTDQIEAGDFAATHQGMAIDNTGRLQDGQHRAGAVHTTGKPQTVWIAVGMPPEHFTKLDDPLKRTANDAATIRGEINVAALTSAARLIMGVDRCGADLYTGQRQFRLTPTIIDRFIEQEGGDQLRDAVAKCYEIRKEIKVVASALTASIYLIRRTVGREHPRVVRFLEDIELGVRDKTDVVHLLRRYVMNSNGKDRGATYVTLALIIKAWNARAVGRRPSVLSWRADERFPATIIVPAPEGDE